MFDFPKFEEKELLKMMNGIAVVEENYYPGERCMVGCCYLCR